MIGISIGGVIFIFVVIICFMKPKMTPAIVLALIAGLFLAGSSVGQGIIVGIRELINLH